LVKKESRIIATFLGKLASCAQTFTLTVFVGRHVVSSESLCCQQATRTGFQLQSFAKTTFPKNFRLSCFQKKKKLVTLFHIR